MFLLLLLLSQAGCDWVEITQNHYKREPINEGVNFDSTTISNRIYINNSVTSKQWHHSAVDKVSHVGFPTSIRRVQYPSVKKSSLKTRHEDSGFNNNFNDYTYTTEADYNLFTSKKPNIQHFIKYNEDDDVIDHQSKVTVTQTSIDKIKFFTSKSFTNRPTVYERKQYDKDQTDDVKEVLNAGHSKQISTPPLPERTIQNTTDIDKINSNQNDKLYIIENPNFHGLSLDDELNLDVSKKSKNRHLNNPTTNEPNTLKNNIIQNEDDYILRNHVYKQTISNNINYKIKYNPHYVQSRPLDEYYNSKNKIEIPGGIDKNSKEIINESNLESPIQNKNNKIALLMDDEDPKLLSAKSSTSKTILNVNKGNQVEGIWKLIKVVADTIYKNTHRSFKSKIRYLENLKTTILTSIEDQVDSIWPDDVSGASARHGRTAHARGHVEFPSSESTLMTISFLTFAVFLIKLVLQVIHTYKNKTMMVTPALVTAVGRAAASLRTPA